MLSAKTLAKLTELHSAALAAQRLVKGRALARPSERSEQFEPIVMFFRKAKLKNHL